MTRTGHDKAELTEREIGNIAPVSIVALADHRFNPDAIVSRQRRLDERNKLNRAERAAIYVAQVTDAYAAYVTSFASPALRTKFRASWSMGKRQTSAEWLNEIIKAVMRCTTKEASRRAIVIKLALHHSVDVIDFPAVFKTHGNEAKCIAAYQKLFRSGKSSHQNPRQPDPSESVQGQNETNHVNDDEDSAESIGQPLHADEPTAAEAKSSVYAGRIFELIAGNPEVADLLNAALKSESKRIVGSMIDAQLMITKFGIMALKVSYSNH